MYDWLLLTSLERNRAIDIPRHFDWRAMAHAREEHGTRNVLPGAGGCKIGQSLGDQGAVLAIAILVEEQVHLLAHEQDGRPLRPVVARQRSRRIRVPCACAIERTRGQRSDVLLAVSLILEEH